MWILDPRAGLISIIASDRDPSVLVCRARTPGSLKTVFGDGTEEVELDGRDYAYRAFLPREFVAETIATRLLTLDYFNVKGAIPREKRSLAHAFHDVWEIFARLQPWPPYSRRTPRKGAK
ncbi:hypothetical protein R75465_02226 [Paraburkholderia aspalathi]|uniref:hypothetical protein n=1 Tax=Paraburkholderia aspalathi TaxID=1324617 RepID=UPI001B26F86D|nr:hypothetical protein [Paraburkholderia aspalathi]CAE6740018.1 hypothetical protein R75465_02226 [Paraburkholderia aspalathi]